MIIVMNTELEKLDENLHERSNEDAGPPKRYYFENLKISLPQVKLSVFTSHKLPPDLKVTEHEIFFPVFKIDLLSTSLNLPVRLQIATN